MNYEDHKFVNNNYIYKHTYSLVGSIWAVKNYEHGPHSCLQKKIGPDPTNAIFRI